MTLDVYGRLIQYLGDLPAFFSNAANGPVGVAHPIEIDPVHAVVLRWGTTLDWAMTITAITCVLILTGIIVSLILFRGHQTAG